MPEKYKKSVHFGIVLDSDCRAVAMSNLLYDPSAKPRIGHVKTDKYMEFDYDKFIKQGYSYTNDGYIVLKDDGKILVTAMHVFRHQGFNTFIASLIRNTDMESELDRGGETADTIIRLALHSLGCTGQKLCKEELKTDGLCRLDKFTLNRDDKD